MHHNGNYVNSNICLLPNIFCWGLQWNNDCTKCKLSAWHLIFKHCSLSKALVSKAIWAAHDSAWQRPPAENPLSYMFIFSLTKKKRSPPPRKLLRHSLDLAPLYYWDIMKNCCAYTLPNKALNNVLKAQNTANLSRNPCKPWWRTRGSLICFTKLC